MKLQKQIHSSLIFHSRKNAEIILSKDPTKTEYMKNALNDFCNYVQFCSKNDKVSLLAEIGFLTKYLSLEQIGRSDFDYHFDYSKSNIKDEKIPSDILHFLIENAIKQSVDSEDGSYIDLSFQVCNKVLFLKSTNSIPKAKQIEKINSETGLVDLQEKLSELYGTNYYLNSGRTNDELIVSLKIPL